MRRSHLRLLLLPLLALHAAPALHLPADAQVEPIHPGAWSFRLRRIDGPIAVDGFVWDRAQPRLTVRATAGTDHVRGLEGTSKQVARLAGPDARPIAAVNGDFFIIQPGPAQGATISLFVRDGELLGPGIGRAAFVTLSDGSPVIDEFSTTVQLCLPGEAAPIGITRVNNSRGPDHLVLYTPAWATSTQTDGSGLEVPLRVSGKLPVNGTLTAEVVGEANSAGNTPLPAGRMVLSGHGQRAAPLRRLHPGMQLELQVTTKPDLPIRQAVGGSAILLHEGKTAYTPKGDEPRHPRTAVGFDDTQVVALTVDGRQPGYSVGMTLPELGRLMGELGCREALNFDGGGSSTCWVRGQILNRPSDGGHERSVANALALVSIGKAGEPTAVRFEPAVPVRLAPGARLTPKVQVTDALFNPVASAGTVALSLDGDLGRLEDGTLIAGDHPATGKLVARVGALRGELPVTVVARPARLEAEPSRLELLPGESARVTVSGLDPQGLPVTLDPSALAWRLDGAGKLADGVLTAGPEGSQAVLSVTGYGTRLAVPVAVAAPQVVEDFEAGPAGSFSGTPATVRGSLTRLTGGAASGQAYARLSYQLGDEHATRAAYLRLDRKLGAAMALRARVRGDGRAVWLRVAVTDGNGVRSTLDLSQGKLPATWTTVQADLPKGIKPPVTWQSVYVVALAGQGPAAGQVDWDRLEVLRVAQ